MEIEADGAEGSGSSSLKPNGAEGGSSVANRLGDRVRVVVRVRPTITEDYDTLRNSSRKQRVEAEYEECVREEPDQGVVLLMRPYYDTRSFSFDCVLSRTATQADTYEAVGRPVVTAVLDGFNGTILAYGQTGTGKTHTIFGPLSYWRRAPFGLGVGGGLGHVAPHNSAPRSPLQPQVDLSGVVTRAAMQIFEHGDELAQRGGARRLRVTISSLQLWQESVSDLLGERRVSGPLSIHEDPGRGVYVDGLSEHEVTSAAELLTLVSESASNRATCATTMNRASSRSHALLFIRVVQYGGPADGGSDHGGDSYWSTASCMQSLAYSRSQAHATERSRLLKIVDLAGSERVCKSNCEGLQLAEAKRINKSISALGNCIAALASASTGSPVHVPFRDSKVTHLLKDSFVGERARTSLCVSVGPALHNFDETFCSLLLGMRARTVKSRPTAIKTLARPPPPDRAPLVAKIEALTAELARLRHAHERWCQEALKNSGAPPFHAPPMHHDYDSPPHTPTSRSASQFAPSPSAFQQAPSPSAYQQAPSPSAFQQAPSPSAYQHAPSPSAYQQAPSPSAYQHAPSPSAYQHAPSSSFAGPPGARNGMPEMYSPEGKKNWHKAVERGDLASWMQAMRTEALAASRSLPESPRWRFKSAASAMCGPPPASTSNSSAAAANGDQVLPSESSYVPLEAQAKRVEEWERIVWRLEAGLGFGAG